MLWENLQDLHSRGLLLITSNNDSQEHQDYPEPENIVESKVEDTKSNEDLEDEKNFKEDLKGELVAALEEIKRLKKENEELNHDLNKSKEEVAHLKLQE